MSSREAANRTPSADPWAAGLTTSWKPRRASISSRASAAPSSRNAVELNATQSGVGSPAARSRCLASTLSMHRMQEATPDPVYGMSRISSSSWGVPSSPLGPWRAMKATSGRSSLSERTSPASASMGITSWPSDTSASSTRAPERSETCRSSELPPFSTATFMRESGLPVGATEWDHIRRLGAFRRRDHAVLGGDRLVQPDLLPDDGADPADPLADLVLVRSREVQAHRVAALAAVHVGGRPGHERHVLAQRLRQQVRRIDVVRKRRPHEQPAGGVRPARLLGKVALHSLEHGVASAPVDVAEAVDILPPVILREVLDREVLGEGGGPEVCGLLAQGDLLHHRRRGDSPAEPDAGREDLREGPDVDDVYPTVQLIQGNLWLAFVAQQPVRVVLDHQHLAAASQLHQ